MIRLLLLLLFAVTASAETLYEDIENTVVKTVDHDVLVAEGKFSDRFFVHKFGRNSDQDSADLPADVWDGGGGGGGYTGFPVSDSEQIECLSTSASDTGDISLGYLLDANLEIAPDETLTLTGTTPVVTVNGPYRRLARMKNIGASDFVGTITCRHTTTTANVFLAVAPGSPVPNQTQVAAFTIPAGYTGYLRHIRVSLFGASTNRIDGGMFVRSEGSVFRMNVPFEAAGTAPYSEDFPGGIRYEEKTDIVVRIFAASANNLEVVGRFDLLVVKNY